MAIKTIEIVNIQSHEYTKIELNKTGITRFYGENNDGKSVITKMVDYFIREKIKDPRVRKAMIRKTNTCGKLIITKYDGVIVTLHLDLEAAKTFVKLERPGQEFDVRYLADKSYPKLIRIAGFHYNKENDITLNTYQTNEPWVFYHMCRRIIDITGIKALNFTIKLPSMDVVKSAQLQEFINSIDILFLIPDITKLILFIESVVEIQKSVETLVCPTCGRSLM